MPYEFLEEVALADMAFKAWGQDLEETFIAAADAVMNAMVDDLDSIELREERELEVDNDTLEMLLFEFLQELIYYKDAQQLLLRIKQCHIVEQDKRYSLQATAYGEMIDPSRHPLRVDVKAVTLHRFSLEESAQGWQASVILDV